MSKKTENIYKSLDNLKKIQMQLEEYNQKNDIRELKDVSFNLLQEIKSLSTWIDSLYKYNGTSKSNAKKTASRENGKKGGRPPKHITEMRKRSLELDELIPELKRQKNFSNDSEEILSIEEKIAESEKELSEITESLDLWEKGRK